MDESKFLEVAKEAAEKAGKAILSHFGKKHSYYSKGESSDFATQADLEAEKLIIGILTKNFHDHNIISEEQGYTQKGSKYTWVIDPLDGTISFAADMPFFAVSIGLLKDNKPVLGVVYWVIEDKLYYAQEGNGAYMNDQKLSVSKIDKLENAALGIDFGHINSREKKFNKYVMPFMNKVRYPYALATDALTLALVAQGALDGFPTDANVWDFAGGVVLIEEAGGKITDDKGGKLDWSKKRLDLVASNGLIHDQILEALRVNNQETITK